MNNGNNNSSSSMDNEIERGLVMRRHRKENTAPPVLSMRMALLHIGDGPNGPLRVGQSLDAIDGFLTTSGKVLRYNPIVRLCFAETWLALASLIGKTWCRRVPKFCGSHTHGNRSVPSCLSCDFISAQSGGPPSLDACAPHVSRARI